MSSDYHSKQLDSEDLEGGFQLNILCGIANPKNYKVIDNLSYLFQKCLAQCFQCLAQSGNRPKAGSMGVHCSTRAYRISSGQGQSWQECSQAGSKVRGWGGVGWGLKEKVEIIATGLGKRKAKQNVRQVSLLMVTFACNIFSITRVTSTYWNINSIHGGRSHLIHPLIYYSNF